MIASKSVQVLGVVLCIAGIIGSIPTMFFRSDLLLISSITATLTGLVLIASTIKVTKSED